MEGTNYIAILSESLNLQYLTKMASKLEEERNKKEGWKSANKNVTNGCHKRRKKSKECRKKVTESLAKIRMKAGSRSESWEKANVVALENEESYKLKKIQSKTLEQSKKGSCKEMKQLNS